MYIMIAGLLLWVMPLLGCYLLRRGNKRLQKKVCEVESKAEQANEKAALITSRNKDNDRRTALLALLLLRAGDLTPEKTLDGIGTTIAKTDSVHNRLRDSRTYLNRSCALVVWSEALGQFLKDLEVGSKEDYSQALEYFLKVNDGISVSLYALGLHNLEDIQALYEWACQCAGQEINEENKE